MLECRRRNRRHRAYLWFKLKAKKRSGFLRNTRRPSTKIH